METTPAGPGISCIDTDLEVDFAAPLGYVEPERKPMALAPTMKDKFVIDTTKRQDVDARGSGSNTPTAGGSKDASGKDPASAWEAFKGSGVTVGGKRIKGKGIKAKKVEAVDADSRIMRTELVPFLMSAMLTAAVKPASSPRTLRLADGRSPLRLSFLSAISFSDSTTCARHRAREPRQRRR